MIAAINPLRYPLFWFVAIGGALFLADATLSDRPDEVIVDETVRSRLANLWQRQTGRPPSEEQLASLVDSWIREEVFYREALRLQLDKDDTIIRRRLIQKLTFIAEDVAKPNEAQLSAFYRKNKENYRQEPRYTFSQIFFSNDGQKALAAARGKIREDEAAWRELGEATMLNDSYASRSLREIASTFGDEFARQLPEIEPGQWRGPVTSIFGIHLVKVAEVQPAQIPPFSAVERQVHNDYLRHRREQARDEYYRRLLEQYEIVRPG